MNGITYYRDAETPFFEIKYCDIDGLAYKKHYHPEYCVGLVEQGTSLLWFEGRKVRIRAGNVVFIPGGHFHSCNPEDQANWRYIMLFFQPRWFQLAALPAMDATAIVTAERGRQLQSAGKELVAQLTGQATSLEKETWALAFLQELLPGQAAERIPGLAAGERPRLSRVKEYLDAHYADKITLADLEQVSGLSRSYVLRLFHEEYRVSPHAYQLMCRVAFAQREIRRDRAIAEVAQAAGFYDQSHFTKTFRQYVGVTPEGYRGEKTSSQ